MRQMKNRHFYFLILLIQISAVGLILRKTPEILLKFLIFHTLEGNTLLNKTFNDYHTYLRTRHHDGTFLTLRIAWHQHININSINILIGTT